MPYYVYILASRPRGTLYIGMARNLPRRVHEHREGVIPGFTKKYGVYLLVYYEVYDDVHEAFAREKRLKRWHRAWKIELIEKHNEDWHDLWPTIANDAADRG